MKKLEKVLCDFKSGFSVFLIALPLCLGIAMASQFPPIAGVITAIVGGIVCSFLGSARLTIKGPAAGLIVIVLGSVTELGKGDLLLGYKKTLAVGAIAAVLQMAISLLGMAEYAEIMPSAVVHGMLAAIGLIIISKQSHVLLGVTPTSKGPLSLYAELPRSIANLNPKIFAIGLVCFLLAFFWPKFKKVASIVPATMMVMLVSISYTLFFQVDDKFLINIPENLSSVLAFPDFSSWWSLASIKYIIMFTLVGTIESLLTVCAIDDLDPEKKVSNLNKDLFSLGLGNLVSSMLGGLPMISEIVRSKANIDYGAKTPFSNFFHGVFLLGAILLFPGVLHKVPLAALAAVLVFVGFRLASYYEFKKYYQIGTDQFFLFVTTVVLTLSVDLLVGIFAGIALKMFLHMYRGASLKAFFKLPHKLEGCDDRVELKIHGPVVFSTYHELKMCIIKNTNQKKKVVVDVSDATLIDHTVQEKLFKFINEFPDEQVKIIGLEKLPSVSGHKQGVRLKKTA